MDREDQNSFTTIRMSGAQAASPIDLIAIGFSRTEADAGLAEDMARRLLTRFGGVRGVQEASVADLSHMTGLDEFEVRRAQALIELGRRAAITGRGELATVQTAQDVVQMIVRELGRYRGEKREHFFAVLLDAKNQVMRIETIHIGTLSASLVGPREVFRVAIREGASSIIVAHNHPSGDPTPSPEDIHITEVLAQVGKMLDIPVLDHLIIGEPNFVSLHQRGVV